MIIDIITIFPNFFDLFLETSIIKKAIENQKVAIRIHDLRTYSQNKHRQVDDTPYGGGRGMLMAFPPFYECLQQIKTKDTKVILLSPQGKVFHQKKAIKFAKEKHLVLLCGHYEGFDARIEAFIDEEVSIGNYVLTGGELPAMIIADSVTRLVDGVIHEESSETDSLQNGLLKYPQYTKPESYAGYDVPAVLLSGHHKNIQTWREEQVVKQTYIKRKDLLRNKKLTSKQLEILQKLKEEDKG